MVVPTPPSCQFNSTLPCPEAERPFLKNFYPVHSVGTSLAADKSGLKAWASVFGAGVIFEEIQEHSSTWKQEKLQPRRENPFVPFQSQKQVPKHRAPHVLAWPTASSCWMRADRATPHSAASRSLSCDAWRQCHHLAPCCPVQRGQNGIPGQAGATSRWREYLFNARHHLHSHQSLARGSKKRQATTFCTVCQEGHWM